MALKEIMEQCAAILASVDGAGVVHTYFRWASASDKFIEHFKKIDGDGQARINGCVITRTATAKREFTNSQIQRVHMLAVRFWMGVRDEQATEVIFQALLNACSDAIDENYTLNGSCETTTPEWGPGAGLAGLQIADVDFRMFAGVLCHFGDCRLGVQEEPVDV